MLTGMGYRIQVLENANLVGMVLAGDGMKMQRALRIVMPLMLVLSLLLVCAPRFDRGETGLLASLTSGGDSSEAKPADAMAHIAFVKWFRGEDVSEYREAKLAWPFRPFTPAVASLLPFNPMTSLNVVNIAAMLITLLFLYLILQHLGFDYWWRILGCIMFIYSFPTFFYGTVGYVDPVMVCFATLGMYCIATGRWIHLAAVIIIGTTVKETIIILFPVIVAHFMLNKIPRIKQIVLMLVYIGGFVAAYYFVARFNPAQHDYTWQFSLRSLLFNLGRWKCYAGLILSFGIPGFLSLYALKYLKKSTEDETFIKYGTFLAGLISVMVLYLYSVFSHYADGRTVWVTYPFTIPLAVLALERIIEGRRNAR